jgi:hypothetical protein
MCYQLQVTVLYPSEGRLVELGGFTALDAVMKKEMSATNGSKIGLFRIEHSHYADQCFRVSGDDYDYNRVSDIL